MSTNEAFDNLLTDSPIMLVIRGIKAEDVVELCEHAWLAGIKAIEVTIESEDAIPALQEAVRHARSRGRPLGAGSIKTLEQLDVASSIGVDFMVAPGLSPSVVAAANLVGVPFIPGVASASEILSALDLGLTWLKAFPAKLLGAEWIKAQLAPFPEVKFIATGGVTIDSARGFLEAGADAVGLSAGAALAGDLRLVRRPQSRER